MVKKIYANAPLYHTINLEILTPLDSGSEVITPSGMVSTINLTPFWIRLDYYDKVLQTPWAQYQ